MSLTTKPTANLFFIEVRLSDTEELIYTSSVLPVGKSFKEIILDKQDLPAGTYSAVCRYNLLNADGEVDDNVSFAVTIVIG